MDKSTQIKFIKAKLALLDTEREQLLKKLDNIEKEASSQSKPAPTILSNSSTYLSTTENISLQEQQIELFRSLFRGRDDVFARLWVRSD
jgi:hypothetical protein